ncbi:sensor histidine kinase [Kibdelosporangium phytohabitans]|uniref:sensor histidine kinase n=1 Tax=Kibdelosporangium phytohabitans TaxID=860235 RepID=UPI0019E48DB8|nr:histidine kinase [Kibdelosporangium phytohabitans]MBE1465166.1 two-component system sensor histidine kinase DesK [Kibdelosporangium phytohabitans]
MSRRDTGEFSARHWPDWSLKQGRRGRVALVLVNSLALLFLLARVAEIKNGANGGLLTAVALGLIACYVAACLIALWKGPVAPPRQRIGMVIAVFVSGAAPALLLGSPSYLTDLTYATVIGLMLLPLRYSLPLGAVTAISQIGWMSLGCGRVKWGEVATLVGVTVAVGTVFALVFTIGHLRAARAQVRAMAVNQERERVARDLHDVLGHSLSTMTVKLGLARRILESTGDIVSAVGEIRELEGLSRQALSDVRATVSDYRTVSLAAEIAGAGVALRAAGVRAELPTAADDVIPALQGVFGYVVREAVTNVLRHSDADRCSIRLGRDWVEITDNGTVTAEVAAGHGLTGLAERLAAVSGTLEHGKGPDGGFRVLARGPAHQLTTGPT